jgi:catalase
MAKSARPASTSVHPIGETPAKASAPAQAGAVSDGSAEPQAPGGDTNQTGSCDVALLAMAQGMPGADGQNSLKRVSRGLTLMKLAHFRDKIFGNDKDPAAFLTLCRATRHWRGELGVDLASKLAV